MNLNKILSANKRFVEEESYIHYQADKIPKEKLMILTCMDTRLTKLLPEALGLSNGDAIIIKNAGGVITHTCGSEIRSILVAVTELQVRNIMVIGHTDCGVQNLNVEKVLQELQERGVSSDSIYTLKHCGLDFNLLLSGFETSEKSVVQNVNLLKGHPLIPKDVNIQGFVINTETGELKAVNL